MSNYLTTPGAAMTKKEREIIRKVAAKAHRVFDSESVLTFVNIGVEYGASLHCLRAGSDKATIFGIEKAKSKLIGDPRAMVIRADSTDLTTVAQVEGPVHVLLIDGGHEYDIVLDDATLWAPKVPIGGFVIFHDYHNIQTAEILKSGVAQVAPAADKWVSEVTEHSWRDLVTHDSLRVLERLT